MTPNEVIKLILDAKTQKRSGLDEVKTLLQAQIKKIKKGDFDATPVKTL